MRGKSRRRLGSAFRKEGAAAREAIKVGARSLGISVNAEVVGAERIQGDEKDRSLGRRLFPGASAEEGDGRHQYGPQEKSWEAASVRHAKTR